MFLSWTNKSPYGPLSRPDDERVGKSSVAKSAGNQPRAPPPPSRRPKIVDRQSMLELRKKQHTGLVPKGGVALPCLASTKPATANKALGLRHQPSKSVVHHTGH